MGIAPQAVDLDRLENALRTSHQAFAGALDREGFST